MTWDITKDSLEKCYLKIDHPLLINKDQTVSILKAHYWNKTMISLLNVHNENKVFTIAAEIKLATIHNAMKIKFEEE